MRLSDQEAVDAIHVRLEPPGPTALSIAAGFWLDAEMYDRAAFAEDTSDLFKREAAIYEALGSHPRILKCMGVELMPDGEEAWALRLERAPYGNLQEYIMKHEPPTMARRLQVTVDLTETLKYTHNSGVIWGDLLARNVLVFDDLHIQLYDFTGSTLKDKFPEILFACEPRYWVPGPQKDSGTKTIFEKDLFALGTAICEITEWTVPYGLIEVEEVQ
ncbi:TKL kinase [Fusarium beomiforme]|uniref:TKL kinase n=1 Tax=Fusarium beomiforme TaxID=44412 RepID=A0A9P5AMB9_9HYPO|nr:TKL kinase [Fusarium beomiforme]